MHAHRTIPAVAAAIVLLLAGSAMAQHDHGSHDGEARRTVAVLVFDDVQIIDFTAPYEVFGPLYDVVTVAPERRPVETIFGMTVTPDYAFGEHPDPDILVIPGGGRHRSELEAPWSHGMPVPDDPRILDWVRENVERAQHVLTVCNGSFVLARAGLLEDREATATFVLLDLLQQAVPSAEVRRDRRWVESGKLVMAGGTSSGLDAALHVLARDRGLGVAQRRALALEHDWDPSGDWSRGRLADVHLSFVFPLEGTSLHRRGDEDRWESAWRVAETVEPDVLLDWVDAEIEASRPRLSDARWTRRGRETGPGWARTRWRVTDARGARWSGTTRVEAIEGESASVFAIAVRRDGAGR